MSSTKNLNENLEVMNCKKSNKKIDPIRDGLLSEYITLNVPLVSLTNVPDISLLNVPLFTGCN